jgi:hypothetical protein
MLSDTCNRSGISSPETRATGGLLDHATTGDALAGRGAGWDLDALTATSRFRLAPNREGPKPKDAQSTLSFERRNGHGQTTPCDAPANSGYPLNSSSAERFSNATTGPATFATKRYRRWCEVHAPQAASISRWVPSSTISFRCQWAARIPLKTAEQRTGHAMLKSTRLKIFLSQGNSGLAMKAAVPAR